MLFTRLQMEEIGFKGSGMFDYQRYYTYYYKADPKTRTVVLLHNSFSGHSLERWKLTPRQFTAFKQGRLSLIPAGCCKPTPGAYLDSQEVFFKGEIKTRKQLRQLLGIPEKKRSCV